jgi:hypothetical protein
MRNEFELRILDLHWIQGGDDPTDLCAHGHPYVRIGPEIVADATTLDVTMSATALYLLRSLKVDYKPDMFASQLLPCCGHCMILPSQGTSVLVLCCPNGIDWTITHTADSCVRHVSENGQVAELPLLEYQSLVVAFADEVERFYTSSQRKILPDDEEDQQAYHAFWEEWHTLRAELA